MPTETFQDTVKVWKESSLQRMTAAAAQFKAQAESTSCEPFIKLAELVEFHLKLCTATHEQGSNILNSLVVTRQQLEWINHLLAEIFMEKQKFVESQLTIPLQPEDTVVGELRGLLRTLHEDVNAAHTLGHTLYNLPGFFTFPIHLILCHLVQMRTQVGHAAGALERAKDPNFGPEDPYFSELVIRNRTGAANLRELEAGPARGTDNDNLVRSLLGPDPSLTASQAELAS